jgi:two-component system chemotaxis sensor kinase CheA
MDLVGELVLTRNQILQFNAEREDADLNATSQRLNLITSELQEGVMKTRMQTIGVVWNSLPRVVRDMAVALGKQIQLKMEGADTELDRTIIEAVKDPLIHLLRNSCDHGIESPEVRTAAGKPAQGTISLRAYHEGGQVTIEVGDDGAGIDIGRVRQKAMESGLLRAEQIEKLSDRETLNLIFHPGFSTVQKVTNISGRGVGMDVVKSHIEKIGGIVDIYSRTGEGTTVKIRIPLTLAIIPGLVITSGGERFVIPQVSLLELIHLDEDSTKRQIEYVHGTPVYRRRGRLLPVVSLNQVLKLEQSDHLEGANMVVLQADDRQFGLLVDGINDTQEIVVKPLGKQLKGLTLYAGATIMGDGRVALILDVLGIGQYSGVLGQAREQARPVEQQSAGAESERHRFLLFKSGSFERVAVSLSLVARLEEFPQSAIESVGGGEVVQYRNRILPLVSLRSILEPDLPGATSPPDPVQVIVFNCGNHSVGMVVDQILDIAEEAITVRQPSNRKGLLGSAVVGKLVTDFLDLTAVIDATKKQWGLETGGSVENKCVLLADSSTFSMGMVQSILDMAGYAVVEAANLDEAIRGLEQCPVDIVLAAQDLPSNGSSELLSVMRRHSGWKEIPVLAIAESSNDMSTFNSDAPGFQDCQLKFDRVALLESMARLLSSTAKAAPAELFAGAKR